MAEHLDNPRLSLTRKRDRLLEKLEKIPAAADDVKKVKQLVKDLDRLSAGLDKPYAGISKKTDAIKRCLEDAGVFLPKQDVVNRLFDGGLQLDPDVGPGRMMELIKKTIQRGKLAEDFEGRVGLLSFPNPKPMTVDRKEFLRTRKK